MNDDERLQKGFAKLRDADERRAPPFDAMWRAPARRRSAWVVALPVGGAVAAAAAVLLFLRTQDEAAAPTVAAPAPAVVAAAPAAVAAPPLEPAPLDFLLRVPGHAALATTPRFDRSLIEGP